MRDLAGKAHMRALYRALYREITLHVRRMSLDTLHTSL